MFSSLYLHVDRGVAGSTGRQDTGSDTVSDPRVGLGSTGSDTVSDPSWLYPSRSDVIGDERSAWTAGMSVATVARPRSAVATRRNDNGSVGATPKRSDS